MKRRDFLRKFGIGAAAAVAAPSIVKAALPDTPPPLQTKRFDLPDGKTFHLAHTPPKDIDIYQYPMTYDECWESNIDEYLRQKEMEKYWPALVRKYGKNYSITDFLKLIP